MSYCFHLMLADFTVAFSNSFAIAESGNCILTHFDVFDKRHELAIEVLKMYTDTVNTAARFCTQKRLILLTLTDQKHIEAFS